MRTFVIFVPIQITIVNSFTVHIHTSTCLGYACTIFRNGSSYITCTVSHVTSMGLQTYGASSSSLTLRSSPYQVHFRWAVRPANVRVMSLFCDDLYSDDIDKADIRPQRLVNI